MEGVDATEDLIVFLKTYEEAKCDNCQFTWVQSTLPAITGYTVTFDNTLNNYVLTLTGTNFGATISNTQVLIDEFIQDIISGSDTEIKIMITSMRSSYTLNVKVYLPIGLPDGTEDLTIN